MVHNEWCDSRRDDTDVGGGVSAAWTLGSSLDAPHQRGAVRPSTVPAGGVIAAEQSEEGVGDAG